MRKLFWLPVGMMVFSTLLFAKSDPTPLQILYVVKKVFPELKEVSVLIDRDQLQYATRKFNQAGLANDLQIKLYPITTAADIGRSIKAIPRNSTLIVMNNAVLNERKSKLYILSKCKERNVIVVAASKDYVDSGALLGIFFDENNKIRTVVNLKHSPQLKSKFTTAFIEQAGIAAVIE